MAAGVVLLAAGAALAFGPPWLGRLPGDIAVRKGNFSFYFPLATCLVISIVLTILVRLFRK